MLYLALLASPRLTLTHLSSPRITDKQPRSPSRTKTDFLQIRIQVIQWAVVCGIKLTGLLVQSPRAYLEGNSVCILKL
jgi:hypothetical protein